MKHNDHHPMTGHSASSRDSVADAIAATVIIACVVALAVLWVSNQ